MQASMIRGGTIMVTDVMSTCPFSFVGATPLGALEQRDVVVQTPAVKHAEFRQLLVVVDVIRVLV